MFLAKHSAAAEVSVLLNRGPGFRMGDSQLADETGELESGP